MQTSPLAMARLLAAACTLVLGIASPSHIAWAEDAQADDLRGTVRDASGAAVANAEIALTTARGSVVAVARTDAAGAFELPNLPAGSYDLRVSAPGFADRHLAVTGNTGPLEVMLAVAAVRQEVTVTASPGQVQDPSRAVQAVSTVSRDELQRRVTTVVAEAVAEEAGVHLQRTSPTMAGIFVRGLTGNKVNVFVDGVRYSNGAQRGGVNTFLDLIDPAVVEGIEVLHGPNSAEYGGDALGGSVQFLTRTPALAVTGRRFGGELAGSAQTAHQGGAASGAVSFGSPTFGAFITAGTRGVGDIRTGGGFDSHAAVTRFLGVPSGRLMSDRLPQTGFTQHAGMVKINWTPSSRTQLVSAYTGTRQDGGNRYDQLLGGDGNLIAALDGMTMDLFYARVERNGLGWFDRGSVTYAINSQREERINQGGNGSATAAIAHEPERTTSNAVQAAVFKALTPRLSVQVGGDAQFERLTSDAFNVSAATGAISLRRPRVPSGSTYRQGGAFAQSSFDAAPGKVTLVGAIRIGGARYEASAADAPVAGGKPLWPDDTYSARGVTFRAGAVMTPSDHWTFVASTSRGFRPPHSTDLGTLGITGSGFEVAAPDVAGRNALVGTTADAAAVSTGDAVAQLVPESSLNVDASARYRHRRAGAELTLFANHIAHNVQKQTLILPQGAVGSTLGTEVITSQNANGAVFVAAATTPVLVRANFDNARSLGLEFAGHVQLTSALRLQASFTTYDVQDTKTNLAPNIEGGIPATDGYVMLQVARPGGRWWVQPYVHAAARQTHLSTLDLSDRRTGAPRTRTSIRAFFLNGATNRGWVGAGPDGVRGSADDVLTATGETLAQIQDRVLGPGVASGVLFSAIPGYVTGGLRGGVRFGSHQILIDASNLGDENYRGISWGVDAPGRGIAVRYVGRF